MFDLITGKAKHLPSHATLPIVLSTTAQAAVATAALLVPALFVAERIPEIPTMLAFVAPPPAAPEPPPRPLRRPVEPPQPAQAHAAQQVRESVAPVEAAAVIGSEPATGDPFGDEAEPGEFERGVPGGIAGGLVGGIPEPPPPPPPPPPDRAPIRVGGQIQAPALLYRVEPFYPPPAIQARLQGIVILEALVDREGNVAEVTILRSAGALDREALTAVRQWRYSPLVLNGVRERFILTVTLSFSLESKG